jgi:molybdenum-dependent DNA-binding transcriptional regulator ModE
MPQLSLMGSLRHAARELEGRNRRIFDSLTRAGHSLGQTMVDR